MQVNDRDLQRQARRRVNQKMGFYTHATVFVLINLGMLLIGVASGRNWPLWPLAGWGLGLAIHGFVTFARLNGDNLRERMMRDEMERLRGKPSR